MRWGRRPPRLSSLAEGRLQRITTRESTRRRNGSVAFPLQPHLPSKHAKKQTEVSQSENHPQTPPRKSDSQPVPSRGRIVNGQAPVGRINASWQYHGIKRKRRPHQHPHDVKRGAHESKFVLPLADAIDH